MAKTKVTLALGSYDRHGPLLQGCIQHPQFDVQFIELDPQQGRHERFLQNFEFDAAELSLSSYLIAIDRGMPVHAVPIFPRRSFSQSQMYKNVNCRIDSPSDLANKRIALSGYQNTVGVRQKATLPFLWFAAHNRDLDHSRQRGTRPRAADRCQARNSRQHGSDRS